MARFRMSRGLSVNPISVRISCMCLDWMLVRGISLPAAQLFVIAIELHWGEALTSIVRGDALIDNAVLQINDFVSAL